MRLLTILLTAFVALSASKNTKFQDILSDPAKLRELYDNLKADQDLNLKGKEDAKRWEIFKKNVAQVAAENEGEGGKDLAFTVNKFSLYTAEERLQWTTGQQNITEEELEQRTVYQPYIPFRKRSALPKEWFWTDGYVTEVMDQGLCGSAWAFAAAGAVETNYAIATGVLKKFSVQEVLDCSYEKVDTSKWKYWKTACDGGRPDYAYKYVIDNQRWSRASQYPAYSEVDNVCDSAKYPNGLIGATVTEVHVVGKTEQHHLEALQYTAISASMWVTDRFYLYERGIYMDKTAQCKTDRPNHAVTMVGYGPEYILVKNSWGRDWGDQGFVKFTRGYHNCALYNLSTVPILKTTSVTDETGDDKETDYNPRNTDPGEGCVDTNPDCQLHLCHDKSVSTYKGCRRTCQLCDVDFEKEDAERKKLAEEGKCGNNLMKCEYDGICRHRYICRWVELIAKHSKKKPS